MAEQPHALITGADGLLASDLAPSFVRAGYRVTALTRAQLDIASPAMVRRALDEYEPTVILNPAAWSDVDGAEGRPDLAERANALGPEQLAAACAPRGIFLVHYSTDYVFEGLSNRPYREDDPTGPVNAYARTKLEGERRVQRILPGRNLVLRVAWLMGRSGRCFPRTILKLARQRSILEVVDDQWGSPTWTGDVATATVHLLEARASGTVHVTSTGHCNKRDLAAALCDAVGEHRKLAVRQVRPVSTSQRQDIAQRPLWTVLDTARYTRLTGKQMPHWQEALDRFVRSYLAPLDPA